MSQSQKGSVKARPKSKGQGKTPGTESARSAVDSAKASYRLEIGKPFAIFTVQLANETASKDPATAAFVRVIHDQQLFPDKPAPPFIPLPDEEEIPDFTPPSKLIPDEDLALMDAEGIKAVSDRDADATAEHQMAIRRIIAANDKKKAEYESNLRFHLEGYKAEMNTWTATMGRIRDAKIGVYMLWWKRISPDSRELIKNHPDFTANDVERLYDVETLWRIMCETHQTDTVRTPEKNFIEELRKLVGLQQDPRESNTAFKERITRSADALALRKTTRFFDGIDFDFATNPKFLAMLYMTGLSPIHGNNAAALDNLLNTHGEGKLPLPNTIASMHAYFYNYVTTRATAPVGEVSEELLNRVYAQIAKEKEAKDAKEKKKEKSTDSSKSGGKAAGGNGKDAAAESVSESADRPPPGPCPTCGGNHWRSKCPARTSRGGAVNFAKAKATEDDDPMSSFLGLALPTMAVNAATTKDTEEDSHSVRQRVIMDCGSDVCVFNRIDFFIDKRVWERPFNLTGIGGPAQQSHIGMTPVGPAFYDPKSPINIISRTSSTDFLKNVRGIGTPVCTDDVNDNYTLNFGNGIAKIFRRTAAMPGHYSISVKDFPRADLFNDLRGASYAVVNQTLAGSSNVRTHVKNNMIQLVTDRIQQFNPRDQAALNTAAEIMRAGAMTSKELMNNILRCAVMGIPVTTKDVRNAVYVYGEQMIAGTTTRGSIERIRPEPSLRVQPLSCHIHVDIMFAEKLAFLVAVVKPPRLPFIAYLGKSRGKAVVTKAIQGIVDSCNKHNHRPTTIHHDQEGAIIAQETLVGAIGITLNPLAPGTHDVDSEALIRRIKERARFRLSVLPYKCPKDLIPHLLADVVIKMKLTCRAHGQQISAWEAFTGIRPQFKHFLTLSFGEIVQVPTNDPTDQDYSSISEERTMPAIVLIPLFTTDMSYELMNIMTWRTIRRAHARIRRTPISEADINLIAQRMKDNQSSAPVGPDITMTYWDDTPISNTDGIEDDLAAQSDEIPDEYPSPYTTTPARLPPSTSEYGVNNDSTAATDLAADTSETVTTVPATSGTSETATTSSAPLHHQPIEPQHEEHDVIGESHRRAILEDYSDDEDIPSDDEGTSVTQNPETDAYPEAPDDTSQDTTPLQPAQELHEDPPQAESQPPQRPSRRVKLLPGTFNRKHYGHFLKISMFVATSFTSALVCAATKPGNMTVKAAMRADADKARAGLLKEINQFIQRGTGIPISPSQLTRQTVKKAIDTHTFLKDKGNEDSFKGRIVLRGDQQDRSLYTESEISSPTVGFQAVLMMAAIKQKEKRHHMFIDFTGAYLYADLKHAITMRLGKTETEILVSANPTYSSYVHTDGCIYFDLKKALYGSIEAGKLWNQLISNYLTQELGFIPNPMDPCVFNHGQGRRQLTISLWVDDIFSTCRKKSKLHWLLDKLKERFPELTHNEDQVGSHLGLIFDFRVEGVVSIDASKQINTALTDMEITKFSETPAANDLFEINDGLNTLEPKLLKKFRSVVCLLLYVAKRVRLDILLPVIFLTTRVTIATSQDWKKLIRVLRYLNATRELRLHLKDIGVLQAYIDASYGVHTHNGRSHSGQCITMGEGFFYANSGAQKIVCKSSAEAEIVALSDQASTLLYFKAFLEAQGHVFDTTIKEDNTATIKMIQNGRPMSNRSRHINIRYFFLKERVDNGEIKIVHVRTADQVADILTKPLQGAQFRILRDKLLGIIPLED